ncbi:MAG TPA: hypothetical protein VNK44_02100 [Candidatus Nitrosotenuis sp.]|nr:hypothetical protein [Candidatus Nitrosotenuis sp.]
MQGSPIRVTLHSVKTIERIAATARNPAERKLLGPIKVAALKDSMFIVDGHAIVEGFRAAGIDTIDALVHQVKSIDEVLALHLRSNYHSALNPFKIIDVINFMLENGETPIDIVRKLQLGDNLTKLVGCRIIDQRAKNLLEDFIDRLSSRYSNAVIPPYFAELVCKLPQRIQFEVVEQFIAIIDITLPDRKFAFPGPETLEIYFKQYLKNKEREPVFFKEEFQDRAALKTVRCVALTEKEKECADGIVTVPGMALLKVEKPGLYRVNMIKKIISPIRDEKEFTIIEGDEGKKIFALPKNAVEFLEISDELDLAKVSVRTLTAMQLKRFATNISNKRDRFVVVCRA